jgi:hypothetical protein
MKHGQVMLLLTVSRSVHLVLEPLIVTSGHILAWKEISVLSFVGRPPGGWTGLPCTGVTVFFCDMCGCLPLLILLCTKVYVQARPVSPGIAQHIMPTLCTSQGLTLILIFLYVSGKCVGSVFRYKKL